jgi:hypothetical protein
MLLMRSLKNHNNENAQYYLCKVVYTVAKINNEWVKQWNKYNNNYFLSLSLSLSLSLVDILLNNLTKIHKRAHIKNTLL